MKRQQQVAFSANKHGQRIAYRVSHTGFGGYSYYRMNLDTAELLVATGEVREVEYLPLRVVKERAAQRVAEIEAVVAAERILQAVR
jgi:hypothetical protein